MISQILHQLDYTGELLQYFNGSTAVDQDKYTFTATGIGTGWTAGDYVSITGASNGATNTVIQLDTVATGMLTAEPITLGADETATLTLNQEYQGAWVNVERWAKLTGLINTSGNCYVYIDQSGATAKPTTTVDYTTTITVTGATAATWSIETLGKWARMRIRNNGADQTIMRAYLYGRAIT